VKCLYAETVAHSCSAVGVAPSISIRLVGHRAVVSSPTRSSHPMWWSNIQDRDFGVTRNRNTRKHDVPGNLADRSGAL
jgi:hypothetical protein